MRYGYLLAKEAEAIPGDRLSVDPIGPYKIGRENITKPLILKTLTMIEAETGWFEIIQHKDKKSSTLVNLLEKRDYVDT